MSVKLILPFAVVTDLDEGEVIAVTAIEATKELDPGYYKIAAMGQPLMFKVGVNALVNTKGGYLAAGDQEIILISGALTTTQDLRFISSVDAGGDGNINITSVALSEIPSSIPNGNYGIPAIE